MATVPAAFRDKNSILNVVRELIKIKKSYPALKASSDQTFIEKGYPAVFERTDGKQTITVLINPSDAVINKKVEYSKVIYSQNAQFEKNSVTLNAQSFAILLV